MELPQIGDRCKRTDCQRLDFLPVVCPRCAATYCSEHFAPEHHLCPGAAKISETKPEPKPVKEFVTCTLCPERSAVANLCLVCKKHFCLSHRHHGCADPTKEELDRERERWNAPKRQFELAKQKTDKIVEEKLRKAANPTALKVQLMRLKSRAVGPASIPSADRAYFWVDGGGERVGVFASRRWPLGRLLDIAVDKTRAAAASRSLTGAAGTLPTDQSVQALIDRGELVEGETLTLV